MTHPAAPDRPEFHLAPQQGWMNDPNGLCRVGDRWHAFYQYHPHSDVWGPMHWGHASSADLLRWEHHRVALAPDTLGTMFSGSVVQDHDDTAGFGPGALVALFTHHADDRQHQSVAYSLDGGERWTKYAGNPVLPGEVVDFRDPKVRRLPDGTWSMVVTLSDHLEFFESPDLVHWHPTGEFRCDLESACGRATGAWECPDLVEVPDAHGDTQWLLVISVAEGGPQGRSGTMAVPGIPINGSFEQIGVPFRMDHGPDFYAFQSFWGARPLAVGMAWMASWDDAWVVPSAGWRGVQSLPRQLSCIDGRLHQWPAAGEWPTFDGESVVELHGIDHSSMRAGVERGVAFIERRGGWTPTYDGRYEVPVVGDGPHLVVVDRGTVEVFADGGAVTLSARVFL
jgi:sucrose-6-phosphate hydrolase SacC (GH32 family)